MAGLLRTMSRDLPRRQYPRLGDPLGRSRGDPFGRPLTVAERDHRRGIPEYRPFHLFVLLCDREHAAGVQGLECFHDLGYLQVHQHVEDRRRWLFSLVPDLVQRFQPAIAVPGRLLLGAAGFLAQTRVSASSSR